MGKTKIEWASDSWNPIRARDEKTKRFLPMFSDEENKVRVKQQKHAEYIRRRDRRIAAKRPDPLLSLTERELAYIAGIVDGEGTVHISGSSGKKTCYPIVGIGMTHQGVIEWLADKWKVTIATLPRRNPRWLPQFVVRLSGKRAQLLCRLILPFLIVKRRQAELVIEFPMEARIAPGVKIANTEIFRQRLVFLEQINSLNHSPRNPRFRRGRLATEALRVAQQD
jgi:hypothetical protein